MLILPPVSFSISANASIFHGFNTSGFSQIASCAKHKKFPSPKKNEVIEFLDSLEDDDDVQNIFSNVNLEVN